MRWPETGLPWVATSPNIPTFETALAYAGTGLFEGTTANEGRGTDAPFLLLGHPEIDAAAIVAGLDAAKLPGVRVVAQRFTPRPIAGVATSPRFAGRDIAGVRLTITDAARYQPIETGVHVLAAFAGAMRTRGAALVTDAKTFNRLAGAARLAKQLNLGVAAPDIVASWQAEVAHFKARRSRYLMYS